MARGISFQQAAMAVGAVVAQVAGVNESEFNPLQQTSRVSLFAAATVDGGSATLKLGSDVHISDFRLPVAAAVSTRDHLVATGLATRGAKVTVGLRNQGVAASTVNGYVVIEPV